MKSSTKSNNIWYELNNIAICDQQYRSIEKTLFFENLATSVYLLNAH